MEKKQPDKKIQVRFPLSIWEAMHIFAVQHGRSFNGEIVWALREYILRQTMPQENDKKQ